MNGSFYRLYRISVVHADNVTLLILKLNLQETSKDIGINNNALPVGSDDARAVLRSSGDFVFISLMLISETAHQSAAGTGDLRGVQRKVLLLRHLYRHLNKIGKEGRAAEGSAAYTDAAEHLCLVAYTDLTQLNARFERRSKILYELSEINTRLGCKIKHEF